MIDVHVHLRDGAQADKETIAHGFRVAASCGISALFDMPNTVPTLTTRQAILDRIDFGRKMATTVAQEVGFPLFYGVYGGVSADYHQVQSMVDLYREVHPALVGLKMFAGHSTGNMGLVEADQQRAVYEMLTDMGYTGVLAVHCEKERLMRPDLWDPLRPESHLKARPVEAEVSSVADQIAAARLSGFSGTLHICHISTAKAIALVVQARGEGMRITCGATAHHALLSERVAGTAGNLCKMNPPLRSEGDRRAVFEALCTGDIDWIESDHAPHTIEDKRNGASGIPGFAGTALLLLHLYRQGVDKDRLSLLCGRRAQEVYRLDWPSTVPSPQLLQAALPSLRSAYAWDAFESIT